MYVESEMLSDGLKSGLQASSISNSWELVGNAESRVSLPDKNLLFNKQDPR